MSDELALVEGWTYSVSTEKEKFEGSFKGYAMIGSGSAVVVKLPSGVTRFIPVANISYMDLVASADDRKAEEKRPEPAYYG